MSSSSSPQAGLSSYRSPWGLLALLVISVAINYIDRGNLAIAAATGAFRRDLQIDSQQLGTLFSAFFVTYSACQIFSGWVIDRFNVYAVYTAGFILWSLATIATGFVGGFASLLALRLVLGIGEAAGYPAYSKLLASHFSEHQRGFANALIDAGSRTGPALGVLGGGLIIAHSNWRILFFVVGSVGLLWIVPWGWYIWRHGVVSARSEHSEAGPGWTAILRQRQAWGTFLGLFCLNYTWYFALNWLPVYLTTERHFTTEEMATYGSLPFWGIAATSILSGWFSDRAIRLGASPSRVRIGFVAGGLFLNVIMIAAYLSPNAEISMVLLVIACLALGLSSSNCWAVTQTLAGTHAAGRWTGLQNGFGNLAGIVGSYLTGWLIAKAGSFFWAFGVASAVALAGACAYLLMVRQVEEVQWNQPNAPTFNENQQ